MNLLPVAERELRVLARFPRTYLSRMVIALAAVLINLGMLYLGFGGLLSAAAAGRTLFIVLACCAAAYALLEGALLTADCLSREKREGTLGLLFLTDLRGFDVVIGKLVSRAASSAYGLLAALPALGIALFLGGVTGRDFLCMMLALFNMLFFAASLGMLISAMSRQERRALIGTLLAVLGVGVLWPGLGWLLALTNNAPTVAPVFLLGSPTGAFWHVVNIAAWNTQPGYAFSTALLLSHALAWGWLVLAGLILPRTWRESGLPSRASAGTGGGPIRVARRRRWLEMHPMVWAGDRPSERGGSLAPAWMVFAFACGTGWLLIENNWFTLPAYLVLLAITNQLLAMLVMLIACRGPSVDRSSGLLEIMLTTPLGETTYLEGRMLLIKRRCLGPVLLVLSAEAGLMVAGCWQAGTISWEWLAWIGAFLILGGKLIMDLYVVSWVGFWQALETGHTSRAVRRTFFLVFLLKWLILLGLLAALGMATQGRLFRTPIGGTLAALGYFVLLVATLAYACGRAVSEVHDHLREFVLAGGEKPDEARSLPKRLARWRAALQPRSATASRPALP